VKLASLPVVGSDEADHGGGELAAIARLERSLPPAPPGETWIGDDTAVLVLPGAGPAPPGSAPRGPALPGSAPPGSAAPGGPRLLFATDIVVSGVHFDLSLTSCADAGWKVLASNVSDVAAMGGRPFRCVAGIAGGTAAQIDEIGQGMAQAAAHFDCPLVGGDLSSGDQLVVSVAILGTTTAEPVLRSGARPGDLLFVTRPLGSAAAGLRLLRADPQARGPLVDAHRRPEARVGEGLAAATGGATAMIDISDGLGLDLHRLALASGVGVELDEVPVAAGATEAEALGGGEDYELVFAAPEARLLAASFEEAGLPLPIQIGRCVEDARRRTLGGEPFSPTGWEHELR